MVLEMDKMLVELDKLRLVVNSLEVGRKKELELVLVEHMDRRLVVFRSWAEDCRLVVQGCRLVVEVNKLKEVEVEVRN